MNLSREDLDPLQQPAELGGRVPAPMEVGDANTPDRKKGKKEKVKDEKKNRKERKSGGWRATLLRCFVCGGGGDSQDDWEISAEERLRIEERIRRAREADQQRFLMVHKVNLMQKVNFNRMLRRRKMTEANKEWSALPLRPEEEADRKVAFQDVDVWYYQDEANPRLGQVWKRVLREIRDNKMSRALQAKWPKKEKKLMKIEEKQQQLMKSEEKQLLIDDMDLCEFLMVSMLCLGFVAALFLVPILLQ